MPFKLFKLVFIALLSETFKIDGEQDGRQREREKKSLEGREREKERGLENNIERKRIVFDHD